ncbi:hypothetical protein [Roseovarius aestuariivivens]|uniref:hypothetical protein n=1 Tax=Roseovarius aestuariivivens TaxID=1888910 RepID=UPI001080F206|nr:hypothetical protein [Roseovarius aestuariivivens]
MSRQLLTSILHWTAALSLLFLLSVDNRIYGALGWVFILSGGAMVAIWAVLGLQNGPGPALTGPLRAAHPWLSRAMYALLGWSALSLALASLGVTLPGPHPRSLLLILGGAALGHAIFHLWRHTALRDGALRRITPRPLHKYL